MARRRLFWRDLRDIGFPPATVGRVCRGMDFSDVHTETLICLMRGFTICQLPLTPKQYFSCIVWLDNALKNSILILLEREPEFFTHTEIDLLDSILEVKGQYFASVL